MCVLLESRMRSVLRTTHTNHSNNGYICTVWIGREHNSMKHRHRHCCRSGKLCVCVYRKTAPIRMKICECEWMPVHVKDVGVGLVLFAVDDDVDDGGDRRRRQRVESMLPNSKWKLLWCHFIRRCCDEWNEMRRTIETKMTTWIITITTQQKQHPFQRKARTHTHTHTYRSKKMRRVYHSIIFMCHGAHTQRLFVPNICVEPQCTAI